MQQFTNSIDIPASADEVVKLITTEAYLRFRYEDENVDEFSLDISEDSPTQFSYTLTRKIDVSGKLPKVAKKIVGDSLTVTQRQTWDKTAPPFPGDMSVEASGMPGKISANTEVVDTGADACKLVVHGEVHVSVPLVGSQLEKVLVGRVEESFFQSGDTVRAFIAKQQKAAAK